MPIIVTDDQGQTQEICPAACYDRLFDPDNMSQVEIDAICNLFSCGPMDVAALATALYLMCEQVDGASNVVIEDITQTSRTSIGSNVLHVSTYVRENLNKKVLVTINIHWNISASITPAPVTWPNLLMRSEFSATINSAPSKIVGLAKIIDQRSHYLVGQGVIDEDVIGNTGSNTYSFLSDENSTTVKLDMEINSAQLGTISNPPPVTMLLETLEPSQIIYSEI